MTVTERLQALLDVLKLRRPITVFYYHDGPMGSQECGLCADKWPCPTVEAITKHLGDNNE